MNILQINTIDTKGGAAKVAHRHHLELQKMQHRSHLLVSRRYSQDPCVGQFPTSRIQTSLNRRLNLHERFFRTRSFVGRHPWFCEADIVHYHNLHGGYFNLHDLPPLAQQKPSFMTLHDPWIIHEFGMTPEYQSLFHTGTANYIKRKQETIARTPIQFISPSEWLANKVRACYAQPVHVIPNGVDTDLFRPQNRLAARQSLNLPQEKHLVLCIAAGGVKNASKGLSDLDFLLNAPLPGSPDFLIIGGDSAGRPHPRVMHVPYIQDESILAQYYTAADVCVFLSRAENFPLVILESLACGTPVVSYAIGGIPEMIEHKRTGYLATPQDQNDLVHGLDQILGRDALSKGALSAAARQVAESRYNLSRMSHAYLEIYQQHPTQTYA